MFIIDELDSVYDGFCNSDHKITYIIMGMIFPIAIVLRFFAIGACCVFRGGKHKAVMFMEDDVWVVKSWYYGKFDFNTKEKALEFCEHNHLKVTEK
jgi:hypothetical protein